MNDFDLKKIIMFLSGIVIFLIAILIVLSIDNDSDVIPSSSPSKRIVETPKSTEVTNDTTGIKTTDRLNSLEPSPKKREDSWENDGTGYLALSETFRKAFIKAVNDNDMTEINLMLIPKSDIYKKISEDINNLAKQKIKMDYKKSELIKFNENGKITLEVKENIGIKKDKEKKFAYKNYVTKYTFERNNQGLIIKEVDSEI